HTRPTPSVYAGPPAFTRSPVMAWKFSAADWEFPPRVAFTELLTAAARGAACTWKFTVFDPAGTVTEDGTVIPGVALPRLTAMAVPPVGAADGMVIVQAADPGVSTVTG